jgi:3D-(3,5/4)-trihydroxycyclohexane-1,2-dione acylhydrolase (decyclizing)
MTRSNGTVRLTVAQAVVRFLQRQYSSRDGEIQRLVPAAFGIFGHGNVGGLSQALHEHGDELPYYQPCNEQSMVHTAVGYAKAMRRRATLACTSSIGPGATNMITGAAVATINRLPVLLLPSDYYATRLQGPVLQQLEHPTSREVSVNDCFRPVSRFFDRITRPEQLIDSLPEAMRVLTDPAETGAVVVALPQDVQTFGYDFPADLFEDRIWEIERRPPVAARIAEAAELLRQARRPLVVAGGGVHYSEAWDELQAFVEELGIPVAETFGGKGAIRRPTPLLLGGVGICGTQAAATIARDADLVICVGTRLTDFTTASRSLFQHPDVRFVSVNVTGHDASKLAALPIQADARVALSALREAARAAGIEPDEQYFEEIEEAQSGWRETVDGEARSRHPGEIMSQGEALLAINEQAQRGDTIIAAAGSPPGDVLALWDATGERSAHLEFGYSCMGYELPAGLGVRMANPDGEVYVFIGDGTYLMNPTELVTAAQEGLKVTVVISQNHGYQVIRRLQMGIVGTSFGNEFRKRDSELNRLEGEYLELDLVANAESFGARGFAVSTPDELRGALAEARAETRPCVIVAEVEKHRFAPSADVFWDAAPAEESDDEVTRQLRQAYEEGQAAQRTYLAPSAPSRSTVGGSR